MLERGGVTTDDTTLLLLEWRGGTADHLAIANEPRQRASACGRYGSLPALRRVIVVTHRDSPVMAGPGIERPSRASLRPSPFDKRSCTLASQPGEWVDC